jgi:hypothetical protein
VPSSARSRSKKRKAEAGPKETAEPAAGVAEELRRLSELRVHLALDVVEAGFKVLAMRYHPDKGGSAETMVTLLQVRADLGKIIDEFYE